MHRLLSCEDVLPQGSLYDCLERLACVEILCTSFDRNRGIWKQIDENREVMQCIVDAFPNDNEKARRIEACIYNTDVFLNTLLNLLNLEKEHSVIKYPRKWPGKFISSPEYDSNEQVRIIREHVKKCLSGEKMEKPVL